MLVSRATWAAAKTVTHRILTAVTARTAAPNRCAFSTSSTARSQPELVVPTGLTSSRGLLAIGGEAKTDFIQGMVTNDVTRLVSNPHRKRNTFAATLPVSFPVPYFYVC